MVQSLSNAIVCKCQRPAPAATEAFAAEGEDVDPTDVERVIHGIWYLPDGPQWRADVGRMLDLVIDGLRYGVAQPNA
jgi:hypothetical protein